MVWSGGAKEECCMTCHHWERYYGTGLKGTYCGTCDCIDALSEQDYVCDDYEAK